jgi:hypothetical protein
MPVSEKAALHGTWARNSSTTQIAHARGQETRDVCVFPASAQRHTPANFDAPRSPAGWEEKMSEFARWSSFFIEVVCKRDGSPRRTELKGFIAYDVSDCIDESNDTTRTMVTIVRLREIQPFGFCAATGPAAAWSVHAVGGEDRTLRHSLSDSSRCGANLSAAIQLRIPVLRTTE